MQRVEIHIKGQIDRNWTDWLGGLEISHANGNTTLSGLLRDQSALHGLLSFLGNLNLELVSVTAEDMLPEKREGGGQ